MSRPPSPVPGGLPEPPPITRSSGSEAGLTLAAVVILTVVLVALTTGLITLGLAHHQEGEQDVDRLRALNAAEAGLARVVDEIWREYRTAGEEERVALVDALDGKFGAADRLAFRNASFDEATYDAEVIQVVRDGVDHADVRIRATGRYRGMERSVSAVMRYGRAPSHVFDYAYFINNFGWLWGSSIRVNGDARSNGNFSVKDACINGDLYASRNEALGALGTVSGASKHDALAWYRGHVGGQARPTNPTCDDAGDDADDNGIPDAFEYEAGYDGSSDRFESQTVIEMPYLGQLALYTDLAARRHGSLHLGTTLVANEVHDGDLVLEGTAAEPVVVDGPVVVTGDLVIKGVVKGHGTIYAGRNVHIAGNVTYETPPDWPKPSADPGGDAAGNAGADLVGLVARGSIVLGDYTRSDWKSSTTPYLKPPFTTSYVVPATDADIGYVTGTNGSGEPTFHGNYTSADGGKKSDGTDRRFYESSLSDAEFTVFADPLVTHIDAVMFTNHLISGRIGETTINGTLVCRDEALIYSTAITLSYDVRVHSDGYESIDIFLPRGPMRRLLFWREYHDPIEEPMVEEPANQSH